MATKYFAANVNNDWDELGNWWLDAEFTLPASEIPNELDDVYITASVDPHAVVTVQSITVEDGAIWTNPLILGTTGLFFITVEATITGDITVVGTLKSASVITGKATIEAGQYEGGAEVSDDLILKGSATTVDGDNFQVGGYIFLLDGVTISDITFAGTMYVDESSELHNSTVNNVVLYVPSGAWIENCVIEGTLTLMGYSTGTGPFTIDNLNWTNFATAIVDEDLNTVTALYISNGTIFTDWPGLAILGLGGFNESNVYGNLVIENPTSINYGIVYGYIVLGFINGEPYEVTDTTLNFGGSDGPMLDNSDVPVHIILRGVSEISNTTYLTAQFSFYDSSYNSGTILGSMSFYDTSINNGTVNGECLFTDNSQNNQIAIGTITFDESAITVEGSQIDGNVSFAATVVDGKAEAVMNHEGTFSDGKISLINLDLSGGGGLIGESSDILPNRVTRANRVS